MEQSCWVRDKLSGQEAGIPPRLATEEKFEVVLGCDLLYEPPHAPMLATAVAARLQPHGLAMLLLPIRDHSLMQVRPAFNLSPPPKIRHNI